MWKGDIYQMITKQYPINTSLEYTFEKEYNLDKIIFFDIETTGFSADNTYLYLIGCVYHQAASFHIIQWFSEDIREERILLATFFEFLREYDVMIHYNGTGFDIPYLLRKCVKLQLDYSFGNLISLDIYKKISPYKKILGLENYKQKTVEDFFHVNREDVFDGGDLIQVYANYLGRSHYEKLLGNHEPQNFLVVAPTSEELLKQLLLHNEDDLKGLLIITPILLYADLFEKPFTITQSTVESDILTINFKLPAPLPRSIRCSYGLISFTALGCNASIKIPLVEGELKYFYDNYKDYYYLPEEDMSIHKSLALFTSKEYRVKAKAANCYTKKQGVFIPQYDAILAPSFKYNYQDKISYIEINEELLVHQTKLDAYVSHLFKHLISGK